MALPQVAIKLNHIKTIMLLKIGRKVDVQEIKTNIVLSVCYGTKREKEIMKMIKFILKEYNTVETKDNTCKGALKAVKVRNFE